MSASELAEEEERHRKRAPWGVIALVLLTGLALIRNGSGEFDAGPPQPASAAASEARPAGEGALPKALAPLPYAVPARVRVPAIQVDAPMTPVGLDADGWVGAPPPEDPNLAGWFTGAVSPGEKGTAVVVGHVDNKQGPAVFYGLGALKQGNKVEIAREDGKTAVFEIYAVEVFEKDDFPGDRVYASKGSPELRVITCGGGFTKQNGYAGNVVAFARLTEVR
ncbi:MULTISPECIES: class F sortase [Streptomyces]|jgi:LPXTG-site transpeptidase (sortase) family protein|uniref:LPXTG-site transpeptidase (Sortase) family protein n=2 Tax=Streptomyces TaxID=1883 RepID=A0ABT9LQD4_STRGD|nr:MULTISPECIES: class F sortase [Streptomyces]MDP9685753.1 LPXTG-site transpeptidase (sortase) family protein [Streptomyces griseoviridis]GGS76999.1 class F sortase [Streptomyces griseoviridis]GGU14384.1 class F sortase [Streptomyces daghestanicus]GHI35044.1 class F sortase [Streptomyces daghestanicus]